MAESQPLEQEVRFSGVKQEVILYIMRKNPGLITFIAYYSVIFYCNCYFCGVTFMHISHPVGSL